jgi:hypothetical protein
VLGLVDSGADTSCFPDGFAPLMGFADSDLEQIPGTQAGGATVFRRANQPVEAWLPEMPGRRITIQPTFTGGRQALWGRGDFFVAFRVSFDELGQSFEVVPNQSVS